MESRKENTILIKIQADMINGLYEVDDFDENCDMSDDLNIDDFLDAIKKDFTGCKGFYATNKDYDFLEKEYGIK